MGVNETISFLNYDHGHYRVLILRVGVATTLLLVRFDNLLTENI